MAVYCCYCKYYEKVSGIYNVYHLCHENRIPKFKNPIQPKLEPTKADLKNENRDCRHFKPSICALLFQRRQLKAFRVK